MESEHLIFGPGFVTDRQRNEAEKAKQEEMAKAAQEAAPAPAPKPALKPSLKPSQPVGQSKPVPDIPAGSKKL